MSPAPKLYEQVAEKIKVQIENGVFNPGQKVPSVRVISRQLKVSVFTVIQAYWALENQGYLESLPKSGFYVPSSRQLLPKEPNGDRNANTPKLSSGKSLTAKIQSMGSFIAAMTNPKNLFLSIGYPGLAVLSTKSLRKSMKIGSLKIGDAGFSYNSSLGYLPLRKQLARHYFDRGLNVSPDQIIMTAGGSESLNICYRMAGGPGGIIAVESPMVALLPICLQYHGLKILEIPMSPRDGMNLDVLKKALRRHPVKACVTMPNFHNPTGSIMPDENKKRLLEILAERGVVLIENDVYGDLHFGDNPAKPAKAFDKTGNVVLCSSFSKSIAPGVRVGWILGGNYTERLASARFMGNASTNALMEAGMADFMERGEFKRHMRKVHAFCETNLKIYTQAVLKYFPEGTRVSRPTGGLLFWVEFPEKIDASKVHKEVLANNILILPGHAFSLTPQFKNCVSISFGHKWSEKMEKVLELIGDLAKKQLSEK